MSVTLPPFTPETSPVLLIVAIVVSLVVQTPPVVESAKVAVSPRQIEVGPVIMDTGGVPKMVTVVVAYELPHILNMP